MEYEELDYKALYKSKAREYQKAIVLLRETVAKLDNISRHYEPGDAIDIRKVWDIANWLEVEVDILT